MGATKTAMAEAGLLDDGAESWPAWRREPGPKCVRGCGRTVAAAGYTCGPCAVGHTDAEREMGEEMCDLRISRSDADEVVVALRALLAVADAGLADSDTIAHLRGVLARVESEVTR
jgi:hypothetical protein